MAIPITPYLAPVPSNSPVPIKAQKKTDPLSLHPKKVPSKQTVKKTEEPEFVTAAINRAFQPEPPSPPINPSSGKKSRASTSAAPSPSTSAPILVSTLPDGRVVNFKILEGQRKKNEEKREYKQIVDWEAGCPDCPAKPATYDAFKMHRSRGCDPSKRVVCDICGKEVAKSNTTHFKNCAKKKK